MKNYEECKKCWYLPFCYDNDYGNFDPENPNCPNWEEGNKNWKQFLKEEGYIK